MIVAHRGASKDAPENTLAAFELAWQQQADAIEGDFQLTKDGFIVCFHDTNTERITNINSDIAQSTLAALRKLDVGSHHSRCYQNCLMPTLAEVLRTIPVSKKIYIEIKSGLEIIPTLLEEVKKSHLTAQQVVFLCFSIEVVQALKSQASHFHVFWLCDVILNAQGELSPSLADTLQQLQRCQADGFSSNCEYINEAFVTGIINNGYEYHVWTIDDLQTAQRFIRWGAKSITTNVPGYLRNNTNSDK
ncbi:glycerophosphodiester phosphodiesterase [Psychromonas sp. MME2]|uniref:glycerophosphodiester phosphodiesterase n=1 Tax=unclassified Psychromonas TaxID=2614957 RepID=UPI00339CB22C